MPPPSPRWNQDLADWNIFQSELEKWANEYDPPQDMDQLELDLNGATHNAAVKAMPLKTSGNYTYKDSWYYCPKVKVLKTRLNRVRNCTDEDQTQKTGNFYKQLTLTYNNNSKPLGMKNG